jgi:Tfp pilus assembly protein PilO
MAMKIENRQQLLVMLVIMSGALLIGNSMIFEPLGKWWSARSGQITRLRLQVTEGDRLVKHEASYRSRWADMQKNALPANTSLAEQQVLKAFEHWSRETGATVTGIIPQWKNDDEAYMTFNCRLEASGSMNNLSRFLYEIENDSMALKLDSVELSSRDSTGQQLTLSLQISGLVLTPQAKL